MSKANFSPAVSLTYVTRNYTGDAATVNFTVTSGTAVDNVLVTENGILQVPTTDYTISGTTLTFTTLQQMEWPFKLGSYQDKYNI
jgi:hypothetical protein